MSSTAARDRSRRARTKQIELFCATYLLKMDVLNNGYQLRVENLVDLYPTNGRYCILQTGERGDFDTDNDLRQLMLRAIPDHMPHLVRKPIEKMVALPNSRHDIWPVTTISNVKTMTEEEYNKWYRQLWRAVRRKLWKK